MIPTLPLWATNILRRVRNVGRIAKNSAGMRWRSLRDRKLQDPLVIVLSMNYDGAALEVTRQARKQSFRVHVFCHQFPGTESALAHGWTRIDCLTDFDAALTRARMLNPVGILTEYKNLLLPMQTHLAEALNLPAVGQRGATTSNSKIALRQSLDDADLPNLPWLKLEDYAPGAFAFPGVVKPDRGTASKGVRFVADEADLLKGDDHAKELARDVSIGDEMLIEGFVKGRQFDLEGIAVDGEYHLICVVEEFYEAAPPYFPPSWFFFNPPIDSAMQNNLWASTQKALRALGVQNGAWHMEQRIDTTGTVRVLDYANRMGYNALISAASGVSFAGNYVALMTKGPFTPPVLSPLSQIQLFAFTPDVLARMKRLCAKHPDLVHSKSFFTYEFSYHTYLGHIVLQFPDYPALHALLSEWDLLPDEFDRYYPAGQARDAG